MCLNYKLLFNDVKLNVSLLPYSKTNIYIDDIITDTFMSIYEKIDEYNKLSEPDKNAIIIKTALTKRKFYDNIFSEYYISEKPKLEDWTGGIKQGKEVFSNDAKNISYEYFEKIRFGGNIKCIICGNTEIIKDKVDSYRYICSKCGKSFSAITNTNLSHLKTEIIYYLYKKYGKKTNYDKLVNKIPLSENSKMKYFYIILDEVVKNKNILYEIPNNKSNGNILLNKGKAIIQYKEHQTTAINKACEYLLNNNRGKIIHPCGTGKTFISIGIIKNLNFNNIVIIIPHRQLEVQQILTYHKYLESYNFYILGSIGKPYKSKRITYLTSSDVNSRELNRNNNNNIFITTPNSFHLLCGLSFNLAIFDESHNFTGNKNKIFVKILGSNLFDKAIFFTATEKIFKHKSLIGMDNEEYFGKTIDAISFKESIDKHLIVDYKIIISLFNDVMVQKLLNENKAFFTDAHDYPVKIRTITSAISAYLSFKKYNIKKIISYHPTIKESILFTSIIKKLSIDNKLNINCLEISTRLSRREIDNNIKIFQNSDRAIISNVNLLKEGTDINSVDAILFAYPKQSKINIVQAVGRSLRRSKNKNYAHIIIPSFQGNTEIDRKYHVMIKMLKELKSNNGVMDKTIHKMYNEKYHWISKIDYLFDEISEDKLLIKSLIKKFKLILEEELFLERFTYKEAMQYCLDNNIKTVSEFKKRVDVLPKEMPRFPHYEYKDEWVSYPIFFSTNRKSIRIEYATFDETKKYIKDNKLYTKSNWLNNTKNPDFPINIPKQPDRYFKIKYKHLAGFEWMPYKELKKYIKINLKNKVYNKKTWESWGRGDMKGLPKKPINIPSEPIKTYEECKGLGYLFGTNNTKSNIINGKMTYEECRKYVLTYFKPLGINTQVKYRDFASGKTKYVGLEWNPRMPKSPYGSYKNEFISWKYFLQ